MKDHSESIGATRVGTNFNPSGNQEIAIIKAKAADLINQINQIDHRNDYGSDGEIHRLKALAMTAIEEGAMWGVKAAARSSG